jgi:hypothetical protein
MGLMNGFREEKKLDMLATSSTSTDEALNSTVIHVRDRTRSFFSYQIKCR